MRRPGGWAWMAPHLLFALAFWWIAASSAGSAIGLAAIRGSASEALVPRALEVDATPRVDQAFAPLIVWEPERRKTRKLRDRPAPHFYCLLADGDQQRRPRALAAEQRSPEKAFPSTFPRSFNSRAPPYRAV